jgi:hypothetical protein
MSTLKISVDFEDSANNKRKISEMILEGSSKFPRTNETTIMDSSSSGNDYSIENKKEIASGGLVFTGSSFTNCHFTFNVSK